MRKRGRAHQRGVVDAHAVVHLEALLEAAQDRDRVLDRGLVHLHRLEAALERGILLDVLAVLVERGRADAVQLPARQHRLEHVAGVHGALGLAGAHDGVQLVDEQQDAALTVLHLGEDCLEPLLELAAVLGACHEAAHVECEDGLVAQALGHVPAHDALGKALGDRSLADAGLADEDGVVLGLARQDADHTTDLLVAADHRVHLVLARELHEVAAVAAQRLVGGLGVGTLHALVAAHLLECVQERGLGHVHLRERVLEHAPGRQQREEQVLHRDVLVAHGSSLLLGSGHHRREFLCQVDLVLLESRAAHLRALAQLGADRVGDPVDRDLHALQQPRDQAVLLLDEREREVRPIDLLVAELDRQGLGGLQGFLRLLGELLGVHRVSSAAGGSGRRES